MPESALAKLVGDLIKHGPDGTRAALAASTGVTKATTGRWANGDPPSQVYWPGIELFFDLPPYTLASAAGFEMDIEGGSDGLSPAVVRTAKDLNELAPEDMQAVMQLVDRLRQL